MQVNPILLYHTLIINHQHLTSRDGGVQVGHAPRLGGETASTMATDETPRTQSTTAGRADQGRDLQQLGRRGRTMGWSVGFRWESA